ncbi:MAG: hypothetical protein ABL974_11705 [Prosthecobacter sp.]
MRPVFLLLICFLSLLPACSTFKKDPKVIITVFSQGSDMDNPKTIFRRPIAGQQVVFKVIPEFTEKSVVAFHPFDAEDGTHGVALKLDFKGTNAIELATRMRQGEILMSMVNGTVVDYVAIDRVVADGIFTIWRGLPDELIAVMEKEYPHIHEVTSSSDMIDMTPSTTKEKKDSRRRVDKAAKEKLKTDADAAKRAARGEFEPELPKGEAVPLSEALKSNP